jgi:hypothetical protein
MESWETGRFDAVCRRSQVLHGNKHVLPVALAVSASDADVVKAAEVAASLEGRVPPNKILDALERLCVMGALSELPHLGRPHPRMFQRLESSYWDFAPRFVSEGELAEPVT